MTYITNGSRRLMRDWVTTASPTNTRCPPTGTIAGGRAGTVDEVLEEAHLSREWLLKGIQRFVDERDQRLERLGASLAAARG